MLISFIPLPVSMLITANIVVSVAFVGLPIISLYFAGRHRWTPKLAAVFLVGGVVAQVGFALAANSVKSPLLGGLLMAVSQAALVCWSTGLGALLASLLREKNMVLPITIFLGLVDAFLVLAPVGTVGKIARSTDQRILKTMAYVVPQVQHQATGGFARPMAYVGPADLVFMAMFFVAMFRFKLRTRETLIALIPTMIAYLLVVLLFGNVKLGPIQLNALPAMVPIGIVVLAVNFREFKLSKDEAASTWVVTALGVALLTWGMMQKPPPEPQPEPSPSVNGQGSSAPKGSPRPGNPNRSPSSGRSGGQNKLDPQ